MKGKHHSDDVKRKISEYMTGFRWWNNGVVAVRAFEQPEGFVPGRLKLSEEWKNKIRASAPKGENHPWYGRHHTDETKAKIAAKARQRGVGRRWWNDGSREVFQRECPEGFTAGRLRCK